MGNGNEAAAVAYLRQSSLLTVFDQLCKLHGPLRDVLRREADQGRVQYQGTAVWSMGFDTSLMSHDWYVPACAFLDLAHHIIQQRLRNDRC